MAFDLLAAQRGATVALNASVALFAGACLARHWLRTSASTWAGVRVRRLGRWSAGAVAAALLANLVVLWLEGASMGGVPVAEAADAVGLVLGSTHYGRAWAIGGGALAFAGAGALLAARRLPNMLPVFVPLAVFWYAQAMSSHAADEGDFNLFVAMYAGHLALISLWVGDVLAGIVVLAGAAQDGARDDRFAYLRSLSGSATFALAGIFVTGLYLAWRTVGSVANLFGTPYGKLLLAKLALVGVAAALGAFNRFLVMPQLAAPPTAGLAAGAAARRFRRVLCIEALVLLAVLAAAAILGSSVPPGMGT